MTTDYLESICDKCGFPQSQCKCYPEPEQDEGLLTDEEINNLDNELVNIPEWINETDEYKSFLFSRRYYAKAQHAKDNQKIGGLFKDIEESLAPEAIFERIGELWIAGDTDTQFDKYDCYSIMNKDDYNKLRNEIKVDWQSLKDKWGVK